MGGKIGRYLIIHDQQKLLTKRTKQKESYAQHHLLLTPASGVCFCFVKPTIGMFHYLSQDWALLSQWWHVSSFSSFLFAVFDGCQFPEETGTTRNWNRDDCFWRRSSCNYLIYLFGIFGHLGVLLIFFSPSYES